ncbi:MAG: hypothetical protein J7L51_02245 [Desulfurococcales archaeon]|nr:hypothetical protein [Desulfurococcales archaeon]
MSVGRKAENPRGLRDTTVLLQQCPTSPHGTYVIPYSYKFSQFILAFAVPIACISTALAYSSTHTVDYLKTCLC